jgi:sugar phosphate isomerase/epimerase
VNGEINIGCNLFGLAFELDEDFWGTMKKLSDSGFSTVEPIFAFRGDPALEPDSPVPSFLSTVMWGDQKVAEYIPGLEELGLGISSMHVGLLFGKGIEEGCTELISFSEKSGINRFITSLEFDSSQKTEDAAKVMNKAAEILAGSGVALLYHNHGMEFGIYEEETGKTFMDRFLELTSNDVKLQVDAGWVMYGGADVIRFLKRYPDRIASVHMKDFIKNFHNISMEDSFAAIGEGVLPSEEILDMLPQFDLMENGLIIDQDRAAKGSRISEDLARGAEWVKAVYTTAASGSKISKDSDREDII